MARLYHMQPESQVRVKDKLPFSRCCRERRHYLSSLHSKNDECFAAGASNRLYTPSSRVWKLLTRHVVCPAWSFVHHRPIHGVRRGVAQVDSGLVATVDYL